MPRSKANLTYWLPEMVSAALGWFAARCQMQRWCRHGSAKTRTGIEWELCDHTSTVTVNKEL